MILSACAGGALIIVISGKVKCRRLNSRIYTLRSRASTVTIRIGRGPKSARCQCRASPQDRSAIGGTEPASLRSTTHAGQLLHKHTLNRLAGGGRYYRQIRTEKVDKIEQAKYRADGRAFCSTCQNSCGSRLLQDFPSSGQAAASARFFSIWPMASTTASKVSMVDACRAL